MEKKSKRLMAPLLGLAAILVVVAIYLMATMPSKDVDMPAEDASPEQVVASYLEALDSRDCDTAEALATASQRSDTALWCRNVARLSDIQTGSHVVEPPELSGSTSLSSSTRQSAGPEVVRVPVTFELGWRLFRSDSSMPDGPTDWGYLLTRGSPAEPWRVFDEGDG